MKENQKHDKAYFMQLFDDLCRGSKSRWQVWQDFVVCSAISISNAVTKPLNENKIFREVWEKRENEYLKIINQYSESERKIFPVMFSCIVNELEENPKQDLLGEIYMCSNLGNSQKGQFFTPYSCCEMMAATTWNRKEVGKILKKGRGWFNVLDCACGGGATLIAARNKYANEFHRLNWQNHVMFVGQDLDRTTAMMCYIQLSLLGCPGYILIGDSLSHPNAEWPQDAENLLFTPMYLSDVWTMRRLFHNYDILMRECKNDNKKIKIFPKE